MSRFTDDIEDFHKKMAIAYDGPPRLLDDRISTIRETFLQEELNEYKDAETMEDKLDALVDLVYVALGTAYLHGFPFDEAWCRVQEANMKKRPASQSHRNKGWRHEMDVTKPEGWEPPDFSDLLSVCVLWNDRWLVGRRH